MIRLYIFCFVVFAIASCVTFFYSSVKRNAVNEIKIETMRSVLEENRKDAKIQSRPDDDATDLLERMRKEND